MGRGILSHPIFAVMLALALLAGVSAPVGAAPYTTAGAGDSVAITESLAAIDGPGHHFGFGQASVLAQTTPQQTQTAVAAQQTQVAAPPPASTGAGSCVPFPNQQCTVAGAVNGTWTKTGSTGGSFSLTATVPGNAILNDGAPILFIPTTAGVEQFTCTLPTAIGGTVTCTGNTAGDLLQNAVVTVRFVTTTGFQDQTGVATGAGAVLTNPLALQRAQAAGLVAGQAGAPCASFIGAVCQVSGQVTGTCTVTGSMTCTVTGTATPASGQGTPIAVFTTTVGNEFIQCNAVSIGGTSATCTGTLAGNALQGSSVAVVFPTPGGVALGTVTGPGGAAFPGALTLPNLPVLPPPPLEFIPPPPPPLLPPPPPAPMGAMAAPRMAGLPEVPVIPEADSVVLLGIGLAAMAVLGGLRARRRND